MDIEQCRAVLSALLALKGGVSEIHAAFLTEDNIGDYMAKTVQDVATDVATLRQDVVAYIAKRDAADAEREKVNAALQTAVDAAVAQHVTDQATLDALQPAIDKAMEDADAARALIEDPAPPAVVQPPQDSGTSQ